MKLNTTARVISMCIIALYMVIFVMSSKKVPANVLSITIILGIFMTIGVWESMSPYRKYKYSDGLRICIQIAFLSILYFTISILVFSFVLIILRAIFDIEALLSYINNFTSVLPFLIVTIIVVTPFTLLLLFIIPLIFLIANGNKEVLEDEFKF